MSERPASRDDNAPRFPQRGPKGHVESWFWRANHPEARQAVWLKATVLAPADGPAVAEAWCAVFRDGRVVAAKHTVPLADARFGERIGVGACAFDLGGRLSGAVEGLSWDLAVTREPGPLGEPLCLFPRASMIDGPFPRNKLLTPMPVGRFSGWLQVGDTRVDVTDWVGMQGHNWGPAHAPEYAWGQCVFRDRQGAPFAMVEAAAGKVQVGPLTTPTLGMLVVRQGDRTWRFDRIYDRWRHAFVRDDLGWRARFRGPVGEVQLTMQARAEEVACLGYRNPDGVLRYCLNSKLARVTLILNPVDGDGFAASSEHGGALEFLQATPDPRVGAPV